MKKTEEGDLIEITKSMPVFVKNFCLDNNTLTKQTRIAYIQDFEYFMKWLFYAGIIKSLDFHDLNLNTINSLNKQDIVDYVNHLQFEGKKNKKRKIYSLRSIFSYLLYNKDDEGNYMLKNNDFIKVLSITSENRNQTLRQEEVVREEMRSFSDFIYNGYTPLNNNDLFFYKNNRLRDAAIISLIFDSGIRSTEITMLNFNDIDLKNCALNLSRRNKGSGFVKVQIKFGSNAKRYLSEYLEVYNPTGEDGDKVALFNSNSSFVNGKRLSRRSINNIIEKYSKAYGKTII